MSLSETRVIDEDVEKVGHLEEDALKDCNECSDPIKGTDPSVCAACASPPDCSMCKATVGSTVFCKSCGERPRCDDCDQGIDSGSCTHCRRQAVAAAAASTMDRYPLQGIPPVGELQDQLLAFLVAMSETCGCQGNSKRCVRCDDAMRLRCLYTEHLGEVRA